LIWRAATSGVRGLRDHNIFDERVGNPPYLPGARVQDSCYAHEAAMRTMRLTKAAIPATYRAAVCGQSDRLPRMRRLVLLLLVVLVTAVTTTDRMWCPDGCLDPHGVAAGHDDARDSSGSCLLCAHGLHSGPRLLPLEVTELASDSAPGPAPRIPMTPPRSIDHPPA
jgi:hypothetical protein